MANRRSGGYGTRLKNFWFPDKWAILWLFCSLPVLYFFQTVVHEGTHAVAAKAVTGAFPKLAPYPHCHKTLGFLNGVNLGSPATTVQVDERTDCDNSARIMKPRMAGHPAWPQFVAFILIVLFTLLFVFVPVSNPHVRLVLRLWYLGACIDFIYASVRTAFGGCNEGADWSKFWLRTELPFGVFVFLTWLFWIVILSHFAWVYVARWGREAPRRTGLWDYRIYAAVLGCLSLLAVILSLAISDPDIVKASPGFILPFILQLLALGWYWTYFGLTFKYRS